MEWYQILAIDLSILAVLFSTGMPLAVAFLSVNIISLLVLIGSNGLFLIISSMYDSISSFSLAALPLF